MLWMKWIHKPLNNLKISFFGRSVDESVRALGCVGDEGMSVTDNVILDVMNEMNT